MWSLITRKSQVLILVAITAILLFGLQAASEWWTGASPSLFKFVSLVATIIGTIFVIAANSIWRWIWKKFPILNKLLFPDLNGQWEGELQTTWVDPVSKNVPGPISTTVTIRQSFFTIHVRQRTKESPSGSTRVFPEADSDADIYRLWYAYSNKPIAAVAERSSNHDGVAWLEVSLDDNPDELCGQYYTSRRTTGDLVLRRVIR